MPASQSGSYLKVIIEAAVGDGTKGDIAVDDVVITDKACSSKYCHWNFLVKLMSKISNVA